MRERADLILLNGRIRTMSGATASAVACAGERILVVGESDDVVALRGPRTEIVDLGGRLVLPAFTDSHVHFAWYAANLRQVDLKGVTSLDEAARRVSEAAAVTPAGSWITGHGWLHDLWGGAQPTHDILDRVAPGHPVALWRNDIHAVWVSAEALRRVGISADTPNPPGGEILRDAMGVPTGVLTENASDIVRRAVPAPTVDDLARAIAAAVPLAHRAGLAGITSMESFDAYRAFRQLHERGELRLRVGMCLAVDAFEEEVDLIKREGRGDAWLRWVDLKMFADGALGPRTAWMLRPYDDDPTNYGICTMPPEELRRLIEAAAREGIGSAVHAIGDAANRAALDAFEATRAIWQPRGLRPRIEHAQIVSPADVPRFREVGVIASMQPMHATQDMIVADRAWGVRTAHAYAFRSLLDAGARLAFGSDCPVETLDVLQGLYAATARRRADGFPADGWHPEQRLRMAEAVAAYTTGAAWAEGEESRRGTIEPGKLADFAILSEDIFAWSPETLLETRVAGTIVGGQWVYREL